MKIHTPTHKNGQARKSIDENNKTMKGHLEIVRKHQGNDDAWIPYNILKTDYNTYAIVRNSLRRFDLQLRIVEFVPSSFCV